MKSHKNPKINQAGLYLFSNDREIIISLNDFLMVTFHSPSSSSTSVLLQGVTDHRSDFIGKLESLFEKYSSLPDVDGNLIQAKVFGFGNHFAGLLPSLKQWLMKAEIPVIASQLGSHLPEEVLLTPQNGKVGIRFNPSKTSGDFNLLSTGTARNRSATPEDPTQVTVLSLSAVTRALAKQCIEEEPSWEADCPELSHEKNLQQFLADCKSSLIILSDEVKTKPKLLDVVARHFERNPQIRLGWIGAHIPQEILTLFPEVKLLPPLEPFLIPHFKKMIKKALRDSLASFSNSPIPFSSPKGKSRSR